MSVLRRAYVEVEPDVTGFDASLKEKLARQDPGGKAGKQVGGQLNRALKKFDLDPIDIKADPRSALAQIAVAETKLRQLADESATVEVKIQTERALGQLGQFRRQLGKVGDDAGPDAAAGFAAKFSGRLGPLLTSLPISGPMGAALAAAGAAGAPVFISAFASGLSAGAGLGVLGVGLGALAKDPAIKLRGAEVGKNFMEGLQKEAKQALGGPVLRAFDQLDAAGKRVTARLGEAFDALAPHVEPFTAKVIGAGEAVAGSLAGAAEKSGPALDGLGDSVTLLGDAASFFITKVSDGGPEAADNLRLLAGVTGDLVKQTGFMLNLANKLASNAWLTGPLLPALKKHYKDAAAEANVFKDIQSLIPPELTLTAQAADGQREALTELSKELKAQTDPAFALLDAQEKLKKAQDDAAAATKKYGKDSDQAKKATRDLALAAIDLQGKAGALGDKFDGKLTPAMEATYRAAGLTEKQIDDIEKEFVAAKKAGDKFDGAFKAEVSSKGVPGVMTELDKLLIRQQALNKGISVSAAASAYRKNAYAGGGWTGPGSKYQPAGIVHADEYVIQKSSRQRIESAHPGLLDEMNATGQLPGHAAGGRVWPYPVTASGAHVMSLAEALSKVTPSFGSWPSSPGAQRGDSGVWRQIVQLIKSTGPMSGSFGNGYRPGDPKWHGSGRAVDWMGYNQDALASFLASKKPLELIHRTRGRDYAYTRGKNKGSFNSSLMEAHRNHIHIAMDDGGMRMLQPGLNVIPNGTGRPEPIAGPAAMAAMSGNTYQINVTVPVGAHPAETGRQIVTAIQAFEQSNGRRWRS